MVSRRTLKEKEKEEKVKEEVEEEVEGEGEGEEGEGRLCDYPSTNSRAQSGHHGPAVDVQSRGSPASPEKETG
ncbi:hypothetical protein M0804_012868 [Polistes exclamans]|nr:hypothetical protein M0804_012868 [Polistes exclamans]